MSALKSVLLAIEVATQKRDQAGRQLGQIQRAFLFAQNQMEQLQSYATDSESKWTLRAQMATSPELMHHHYQFMERLRHAIGLQDGAIHDLLKQVDLARQQVLEAEFRLAGLKQVMSKKKMALQVVEKRREQRQMDEFATQLHRRFTGRQHNGERS